MKNSVSSYENTLIIDGHKLPAVQSVNMSYEVPQQSLRILGVGHAKNAVSGPPQGNLSISRVMTHKDPLIDFTGDLTTDASLEWQGASFGFKNLYLNSYGANFSVGSMPDTSAQFTSYDVEVGGGLQEVVSEPTLQILPVSRGQIEIVCSGYQTNRVLDCSFQARINRQPIYTFEEEIPNEVVPISPIEVDMSFNIEIDDYEFKKISHHLLKQEEQNVSIKVRDVTGFYYTQVDASPYTPSWSGRISVIPSGLKGGNLFKTGELIRLQNTNTKAYIDRTVTSIVEGTFANIIGFDEPFTQDFIVDGDGDANYGQVRIFPYIFSQDVSGALLQSENVSAAVDNDNSVSLQYKAYLPI